MTALQRYRVVIDAGFSEKEQMIALGEIMSESDYERLQIANDFGVTPEDYVRFVELKPAYDEDGNGNYTQAEVAAAIKDLRLGSEAAAALWQLANKAWKAKNNPFNKRVGQRIYDALNGV